MTTAVDSTPAAARIWPGPDDHAERVRAQYEAWPYPRVPIVGQVRRNHTWQLNAAYLADRCGLEPPAGPARVWIAGCGTLQPYVFALANPGARVLATDMSRRSLAIARRRCRWHGQRQVTFDRVDLEHPESWPDGPFDLIECYGVLMNLADPGRALAELGRRLVPGGVLRVMVYTHFGRQRIFQIQRLAQLLGVGTGADAQPRLLRRAIASLPPSHPLRFAFDSYADSANDAGVVDGFLHAGDCGFTGIQLGRLVEGAGLRAAWWVHRPWGQPGPMREALGLHGRSDAFVLHYLDLWQELRSNFVACLVRGDAPIAAVRRPQPHPLLDAENGALPWRHRAALVLGRYGRITLPTRTGDARRRLRVRLASRRALAEMGDAARAAMQEQGVALGGRAASPRLGAEPDPACQPRWTQPRIEVGAGVANPLYDALFKAYTFSAACPEARLGDLATQVARWRPHAEPLEERGLEFGLTPFATQQRFADQIEAYVARWPQIPTVAGYGEVRLRGDGAALARVRLFAAQVGAPAAPLLTEAQCRELWVLLFSHQRLFLGLEGAS